MPVSKATATATVITFLYWVVINSFKPIPVLTRFISTIKNNTAITTPNETHVVNMLINISFFVSLVFKISSER